MYPCHCLTCFCVAASDCLYFAPILLSVVCLCILRERLCDIMLIILYWTCYDWHRHWQFKEIQWRKPTSFKTQLTQTVPSQSTRNELSSYSKDIMIPPTTCYPTYYHLHSGIIGCGFTCPSELHIGPPNANQHDFLHGFTDHNDRMEIQNSPSCLRTDVTKFRSFWPQLS